VGVAERRGTPNVPAEFDSALYQLSYSPKIYGAGSARYFTPLLRDKLRHTPSSQTRQAALDAAAPTLYQLTQYHE